MPIGRDGVRAGTTVDTTPAGASERGASATSTPSTQRTHVCGAECGSDWVDADLSFCVVHPSGQQNLSIPAKSANATSVTIATHRATR
jgi:hypothetical protein